MKVQKLIPQVLAALERWDVSLEDGPTALILSYQGKRVLVQVAREGDCLRLSTGKVWKRAAKVPLSGLRKLPPKNCEEKTDI